MNAVSKEFFQKYNCIECGVEIWKKESANNEQNDEQAETDDGWISVKDRLPEPKTWVLAYIKYPSPVFEIERGVHKTGNIKKLFYDGFCDALSNYPYGSGKVTHWMPLPPEPPKGE